jgi:YfiH family protein
VRCAPAEAATSLSAMAADAPTLALPHPFTWADDDVAIDLGGGARALFTGRRGGVSRPPFDTLNLGRWTDDDPDAVERNRERVAASADLPLVRVAQGRQVHGTDVRRVTALPAEVEDGDGQATALRDVGALVLTADCLPVALATPGAIAVVHAGWRGLAGGILEEGVRAVRELGGEDGELVAAIGPGAGGCCYEVGDDVRAALGVRAAGAPAAIDLKALAAERLVAAGASAVHDCGLCTMCTDRALFFSHRRDGPVTGRQGGIAWRPSS